MQPLWFGPATEPIFGTLHEPVSARDLGAVVCASAGFETVGTHRSLRLLAGQLAASGVPTLRFDWPGTGDSSGVMDDPGRVPAWLASVASAIDVLREATGVRRVALVGVRLGALLALEAVDRGLDVDGLVLLFMPEKGEQWLREARARHRMGVAALAAPDPPAPALPEGAWEVNGLMLTRETREALTALDPAARETWPREPPPVLLLRSETQPPNGRCESALVARGGSVEATGAPGYAMWMVEPAQVQPPRAAFDRIERWIVERAGDDPGLPGAAGSPGHRAALSAACALPCADGVTVHEEAIQIPGPTALRGIVARPQAPTERPWVVLLNSGPVRRVGPNRLWVRCARAWAAAGVSSLRLDGRSMGDSDGEPGPYADPEQFYEPHVAEDVQRALTRLESDHGAREFILIGLCSGATASFQTALRNPAVRGCAMINTQVLFWDREHLAAASEARLRSAFAPSRLLRRARRGDFPLRRGLDLVRTRLGGVVGRRLRLGRTGPSAIPGDVGAAFDQLVSGGVRVLLVYSQEDPGIAYLERSFGGDSTPHRGTTFDRRVFVGPDHTFQPIWAQQRLYEQLTDFVLGPGSAAASPR